MAEPFLTLEPAGARLLVLRLGGPGKLSTLSRGMIDALAGALDEIEAAGPGTGLVVVGGKPSGFLAGADLKELASAWGGRSTAEVRAMAESVCREVQDLYDRLEALPGPTVAAIHGACLGGGFELALAMKARVAADDPATSIGLPEVNLGLIPAAGGTQRLPRLIGMAGAMDAILGARRFSADEALKKGLVDRVVPPASLLPQAMRLAAGIADGSARLVRNPRRGFATRLLEAVGWGRDAIESKAVKEVQKKTRGHYPAPVLAARLIGFAADGGSPVEGLRREREAFGELASGKVAANLIRIFFLTEGGKAGRSGKGRQVTRMGVVGAGFMGSGVAQLAAAKGFQVRLTDRDDEGLAGGMRRCADLFRKLEERGRLGPGGVRAAMGQIVPVLEHRELARCQLVVEAVFEDVDLKRGILASVEQHLGPDAVLATNTSGIPLSRLTSALSRPENLVGMHFFSPVHKMPLLEVVAGEATSAEAVATAVETGRRMGKTVIVVRDGPGFFTTRVLGVYLAEAFRCLLEGNRFEAIDRALEEFGWPVGPFKLLDEVGIDVGAHVSRDLHLAFPDRVPSPEAIVAMVASGRKGRKAKRGFYRYDASGKSEGPDASVYAELPGWCADPEARASEAATRIMAVLADECVRCLEEGIVASPDEADTGLVLGLGFPPFRGGMFRWLDDEGGAQVLERLEALAARGGPARTPRPRLVEAVREGRRFHG